MKGIIILTVCILTATAALATEPVNETLSIEADFNTATAKSKQLSKAQVLIFSAKWCAPCIKMKENTLTDAAVVRFLNDNTINTVVDIDTREGFRLMSEFEVKELPSVIILDENGTEIARKKEFLSSTAMLKFVASATTNVTSKKANIDTINKAEKRNQETNTTKSGTTPSVPVVNAQNQSKVPNVAANTYGVQIGVFSNIETALAETIRIQKLLADRDILILNKQNQIRLVIGVYISKESAQKIKAELKENGLDGFVKDLSSL